MNRNEELQALNLNFLVKEFLLPEIGEVNRETQLRGRQRGARTQGALIETFGWLYLGVQVGYFHQEHAKQLLEEHHGNIFPKNVSEVSLINSLFPELSPALTRAARGDLLPELGQDFQDKSELQLAFRSALVLGSGFARDALSQVFTTALDFSPEASWKILTSEVKITPDQILLALNLTGPASVATTPETLYAGFLRTMEYMDAARDMFMERALSPETSLDELELWRRVRQLQAWRVNLRDRKERFMEVAGKVNNELNLEWGKANQTYEQGFFLREVNELVSYWLGEAIEKRNEGRTATA